MSRFRCRVAMCALLLAVALPAAAQKVRVENQGQAAHNVEAMAITKQAVEESVGKAPAGKAQVVFYRSSSSPGAPVAVRDAAAGEAMIDLDPGMYFVSVVTPGARSFATSDVGPFPMDLEPGRTYYVQAIRNRKGQSQLLRSSADKFARAAK